MKAYFGCFEGADVQQRIFIELRRTDGEATDDEVVEVTVSPTEGGLQNFVQLSKIEPNGKFEAPGDTGLDANDEGIQANDESVGIKGIEHAAEHARRYCCRQYLPQRWISLCSAPDRGHKVRGVTLALDLDFG